MTLSGIERELGSNARYQEFIDLFSTFSAHTGLTFSTIQQNWIQVGMRGEVLMVYDLPSNDPFALPDFRAILDENSLWPSGATTVAPARYSFGDEMGFTTTATPGVISTGIPQGTILFGTLFFLSPMGDAPRPFVFFEHTGNIIIWRLP